MCKRAKEQANIVPLETNLGPKKRLSNLYIALLEAILIAVIIVIGAPILFFHWNNRRENSFLLQFHPTATTEAVTISSTKQPNLIKRINKYYTNKYYHHDITMQFTANGQVITAHYRDHTEKKPGDKFTIIYAIDKPDLVEPVRNKDSGGLVFLELFYLFCSVGIIITIFLITKNIRKMKALPNN